VVCVCVCVKVIRLFGGRVSTVKDMAMASSDSHFCCKDTKLIDVVDDQWAADTLSDDEIVVSSNFRNPQGEEKEVVDTTVGTHSECKKKTNETWTDLDLGAIARA